MADAHSAAVVLVIKKAVPTQKPCGYGTGRQWRPIVQALDVLWHQPTASDLLFITLRTSEALFSPTTRTRDLALGPSLFHWESQSTTTAASATRQRYLHHEARGSRVMLLVREQRRQGGRCGGPTEPFVCLGLARYESQEGESIEEAIANLREATSLYLEEFPAHA